MMGCHKGPLHARVSGTLASNFLSLTAPTPVVPAAAVYSPRPACMLETNQDCEIDDPGPADLMTRAMPATLPWRPSDGERSAAPQPCGVEHDSD